MYSKSHNDDVVSLPAHFHHVIELLRFRQGTLSGIFLSAGEHWCINFCAMYSEDRVVILSNLDLGGDISRWNIFYYTILYYTIVPAVTIS